jgi:hypothetical protein
MKKLICLLVASAAFFSAPAQAQQPGPFGSGQVQGNPTAATAQPRPSAVTSVINAACTLSPSACALAFGYLKPEWYGAVGDCSTDDQTAITSAIAGAVAQKKALIFSLSCYAHNGTLAFGFNNIDVRFFGFVWLKELGSSVNVSIDAGTLVSDFRYDVQFGRGNPPYLEGNSTTAGNLFVRGVVQSYIEARGGNAATTSNNIEVNFAVGTSFRLIVDGNTGATPLITSKSATAILLSKRNSGEGVAGCQVYVVADSMVNGVVIASMGVSHVTGFSENNSGIDLVLQKLGTDSAVNNTFESFDIEGIGGATGLVLGDGTSANTFIGMSVGGTKNVRIDAGAGRNVFKGGVMAATVTDNGSVNKFEDLQAVTFSPNSTTSWQRVYNGSGVYYPDRPIPPVTFATLAACSATYAGAVAEVTDSTTAVYGATITGGGANKVKGRCNSTNWIVEG